MGPFDRFNDRAKRVFALAQDEAIRFNHNYIGPEHLLLGLVREGEGVAANVLHSLGVELAKVRTAVEFLIGRGQSGTTPSEITLSPLTKKVVENAIEEARKLGHSHVGTEHLLLGLARDDGMASGILQSLGVTAEKVRHQVSTALGQQPGGDAEAASRTASGGRPQARATGADLDRLDAAASRVLARAYWEAGRANRDSIGAEHLLLALIASDSEWLGRIWKELATHLENLGSLLEAAPAPPPDRARPPRLTLAPDLSLAIDRAASSAAQRGSALVRPEHLLLGVVAAAEGPIAAALAAAGVTPERLREVVEKLSH